MKKILFLALLLAASCGKAAVAPEAEPAVENDGPAAVFIGDSITENWAKASTGHPDFFSGNGFVGKGVSGQTTARMVARFYADVVPSHPKQVVILAGVNDIAQNDGVYVSNEEIRDNIARMAQVAENNGVQVVLCSVLPCTRFYWKTSIHPEDTIIALNRLIRALAAEKRYAYVDFHSAMADESKGLPSELSSDGCHPTKAGYERMEQIILPVLRGEVSAVPEPEPDVPSDGVLRILAIGNSFSQDAVEQYLWDLFGAAGQEVVIGNLYIGGCTLERHAAHAASGQADYAYRKVVDGVRTEETGWTLAQGLADEPWDYVSLQQASGSSGIYSTYTPYLAELVDYVKARTSAGVKVAFHETWAYAATSDHTEFPKYGSDQQTMYAAIVEAVQQAVREHGIGTVIPSGTAIQNARTSYLGDSFNRDGYHLETTYGRYTAACTWFETLSGIPATDARWFPASIDAATADLCRTAAHLACVKPYAVTELVDYQTPSIGDPSFSHPVRIDFGGGSSATPTGWTRVATYAGTAPIYLKNTEGETSSVYIAELKGFTGTFNGVGSEPDRSIVAGGTEYPRSVWSDALLVSGNKGEGDVGPAEIVLAGLDAAASYDLDILAVRFNGSASARISEFSVVGAGQDGPRSVYTGLKAWGEDVAFDDYAVRFTAVRPDAAGRIVVRVVGKDTAVAVDGHISALCIGRQQP